MLAHQTNDQQYRESLFTRENVTELAACFAGMLVGAGLMYILDPVSGRRRRALIRNKLTRYSNEAQHLAGDLSRYAADKGRGFAAEARAWATEADVPDATLVERVRSQMGRGTTHPSNIEVFAENGCVTLRGMILSSEVGNLLRTVRRVRGVKQVINELDCRSDAVNTPELQGEGSRQAR
jgi:hypothetical protein